MDFMYLDADGNPTGAGFNAVKPLGEGAIVGFDHPPVRVTFRLVDGSQPEDWNPRHGDRPCRWNRHDGTHPLDGCPDMHAAMEPPPDHHRARDNATP